jgi:hypothetical protein
LADVLRIFSNVGFTDALSKSGSRPTSDGQSNHHDRPVILPLLTVIALGTWQS